MVERVEKRIIGEMLAYRSDFVAAIGFACPSGRGCSVTMLAGSPMHLSLQTVGDAPGDRRPELGAVWGL